MMLVSLFVLSVLAAVSGLQTRDLPAGCDCTGPGCQYGPISDPAIGSITMLAENGTDVTFSHRGEVGFTVSTLKSDWNRSVCLTGVAQLAASWVPPPCYPETIFALAVLNGSTVDKIFNSPTLVGPILTNLGGTAEGGNASYRLLNEPLIQGNLYRK